MIVRFQNIKNDTAAQILTKHKFGKDLMIFHNHKIGIG